MLTNDPVLLDWITSLYEACLTGKPGPASHVFTVCRHTSSDSTSVSLYRDSRAILQRVPADLATAQLVWEVNRGVIEEAGNRLLLHAAAAERHRNVVVLAGPEGSGKSTLVAALVQSGLRYVTDETVAIEVPSATITPYPKPIGLLRDSPGSLRELWQADPRALETELEQLLVPAQAIRRAAVADPGGIGRVLVFPAYRPGQGTAARAMSRAEAALALAEQAFNFRSLGPERLEVIAKVVRGCDCYRLELGDLDAACCFVLDALEQAIARQ